MLRHFEAWGRTVKGLINGTAGAPKLNPTRERRCTGAGPLLDRIDLHVEAPVTYKELRGRDSGMTSAQIRENSLIPPARLRDICAPNDIGERTRRWRPSNGAVGAGA